MDQTLGDLLLIWKQQGLLDMNPSEWTCAPMATVTGLLASAVARHPHRSYLDFSGTTYTYGDIDRESTRLARGLTQLGLQRGQTVTSMLDNNVDAVITWFAINKAGGISVPINNALKGEFLRHQIADSAAHIVIAEADYCERLAAIHEQLPDLRSIVHRGSFDTANDSRRQLVALEGLRLDHGAALEDPNRPGDLALLIYTSGTTGPSKGCMISHNYACNLARQSAQTSGLTEADILWTALPLFHMNAVVTSVLATLLVGSRAAIYPRFSLSNFWPEIERTGATFASLLGSMITLIAQAPDTEASRRCRGQLRGAGGQPFPAQMQAAWQTRFGVKTAGSPCYGLTEACLVTSLAHDEYSKPGTSGKKNDCFDVMIVDDEDREVPAGVAGEIVCRPRRPHVMFEGYWRRPEDTLKIMRNMWLHSGDIGKFDPDGFFHFVDRKKDYLRRRGENISSYEVEATFLTHPAIADVAVHAVPSSIGEDDLKVTAILMQGARVTEEELCRWAIDKLPYFAVPLYIEFRRDLPRNPTGKILKYQLRAEGVTANTWNRESAGIELVKR